MTQARKQKGATLIEALISVGLLAGLASLLAPAIYGVTRTTSEISNTAKHAETARTLDKALSQIIGNHVVLNNSDKDLQLGGDSRSLSLVSLAGDQSNARHFTLIIDRTRLIGEISPLADTSSKPETFELLDSGAISFSYFGRTSANAPLRWHDRWSSKAAPFLIRLQYQNPNTDKGLLAREYSVTSSAPLHCQFDPVSRRCRA